MAVLADVCRQYVGWVFTRRVSAVVATDAVVRNVHVIEVGRYPGNGRVAVVAVVTASDVGWVLASGRVAVVAGEAGPEYRGVVDGIGGYPGHVVVTILANIGR